MVLGPILQNGATWMVGVSDPDDKDLGLIMRLGYGSRFLENFGFFDYTEGSLLVTAARLLVGPKSILTVN